jgi:hypothetical protein
MNDCKDIKTMNTTFIKVYENTKLDDLNLQFLVTKNVRRKHLIAR